MNLLYLLPLLCAASADDSCYMCQGGELKLDEPFNINSTEPFAILGIVNGSIGTKTLSMITHVVELQIYATELDYIENGALCSPPKLRNLAISHEVDFNPDTKVINATKFPVFTEGILSNCDNLGSFVVKMVKLKPDALKHMSNLEELTFTAVSIPQLTSQFLESLAKLKSYRFGESRVEQVDSNGFCAPRLEKIEFWLSFLPPLEKKQFNGCNTVERISISYHQECLFDCNENIQDRSPTHQLIEENTFSDLPNLKSLRLTRFLIGNLTWKFLSGSTKLENLYLQRCNISEIDSLFFKNLKSLKYLVLSTNSLTSLDNIIDLPELINLEVDQNQITHVNVTQLKLNFPKLEAITLSVNPMKYDYVQKLISELENNGIEGRGLDNWPKDE